MKERKRERSVRQERVKLDQGATRGEDSDAFSGRVLRLMCVCVFVWGHRKFTSRARNAEIWHMLTTTKKHTRTHS